MTEIYCKLMALMTAERDEKGATAVEYGLLVALIAAVIVGVVFTLGGQIEDGFTTITTELGKKPE